MLKSVTRRRIAAAVSCLLPLHTSGTDIVEAYLVDDVKDFDVSDYDDLLDGDGLADEAGIVIDEAADVGSYDLVLYYGSETMITVLSRLILKMQLTMQLCGFRTTMMIKKSLLANTTR